MSTPSIAWIEWFDKEKELLFTKKFANQWPLFLRNGISGVIYTKWIREVIGRELNNLDIDTKQIKDIETKWLEDKKIDLEEYSQKKSTILEEKNISETLLEEYCINELKAFKWAKEEWGQMVPQIFLEEKERYDLMKVKILYVKEKEKGIALEIYQMLTEGEEIFENISSHYNQITLSTHPHGSWIKKVDLKPQLRHAIERLKTGQICKPIKINDKYVIAQLMEAKGSRLDKDIEAEIIKNQLNRFINYGIAQLIEYSLDQTKRQHDDKIRVVDHDR